MRVHHPRRRDAIFAIVAAVLVVVCAIISAAIVWAVYRVEVHRPPGMRVMVFICVWFLLVYGVVAFAVQSG